MFYAGVRIHRGPKRRPPCLVHIFKTSFCTIFGTLQECFALNTSVNFIFISLLNICVCHYDTLRIRDDVASTTGPKTTSQWHHWSKNWQVR